MSARYRFVLDHRLGSVLRVEFSTSGGRIVDYAVVLLIAVGEAVATVRLYDAAHGFNEMHRYTRTDGKQQGVAFHPGTLGEGMRAAIAEMRRSYPQMIEGWER